MKKKWLEYMQLIASKNILDERQLAFLNEVTNLLNDKSNFPTCNIYTQKDVDEEDQMYYLKYFAMYWKKNNKGYLYIDLYENGEVELLRRTPSEDPIFEEEDDDPDVTLAKAMVFVKEFII